jgi:hypothetical protein
MIIINDILILKPPEISERLKGIKRYILFPTASMLRLRANFPAPHVIFLAPFLSALSSLPEVLSAEPPHHSYIRGE